MDWQDFGDKVHETGKRTMIHKISDFIWYSLNAWGRDHASDDQTQCESYNDCLGEEDLSDDLKCCASIKFKERSKIGENLYIYRCLNRGLIGVNMHFLVPDSDIDVQISCDNLES